MPAVDPSSPVPLYHQIAESIRGRIASGELSAGEALEPLREAAERWGVNLHTVRHAYTALAREGLVETSRGARGTRVALKGAGGTSGERLAPARESTRGFLQRVVADGRRHGLSVEDLAAAIGRTAERPVVSVIECSEWQCEAHARELMSRWDLDAQAWSLEREGEPPHGHELIATYFHYNDIRLRWPRRLREVRFITIAPSPEIAAALPGPAPGAPPLRIVVCELDEPTAQNVAADLSCLLPAPQYELIAAGHGDPHGALRDEAAAAVLFPPRVWSGLDPRMRNDPRAVEARYVFDDAELLAVGASLGWPTRTPTRKGHP